MNVNYQLWSYVQGKHFTLHNTIRRREFLEITVHQLIKRAFVLPYFPVKMLSLKLFRQSKCSVFAAQRQMSFRVLPKCINQFNAANRLGNTTLAKPLVSASIIARFTGSTTAVKSENNYASLWKTERIVSVALIGLFPAALLYPSQILDTLLAVGTSMHVYWGMEALVVDYLREPVVGQLAKKAGHAAVSLLTIITLAGFLQVIFVGDGLGNAIIQLWKL